MWSRLSHVKMHTSVRIELGKTHSRTIRERILWEHMVTEYTYKNPDAAKRSRSFLSGQRRSRGDGLCQFTLSHQDYLPLLLFTLSWNVKRHSYDLAIASASICNGHDRLASLIAFWSLRYRRTLRSLSRIFGMDRHPHIVGNNNQLS